MKSQHAAFLIAASILLGAPAFSDPAITGVTAQ